MLGVGAGDEGFKLGDRTWRETSESQLSELDHLSRFGLCLWAGPAVIPAETV